MTVKVFITIDTEEDNWGTNKDRYNNPVENVRHIPMLQDIFDRYEAVPTYLVNYPVATTAYAVEILKPLLQAGKCDIGTHCHPWNSPPYVENLNAANTMLSNLSINLIRSKLENIHRAIEQAFEGHTPTTFRAGRWALSENVAQCLLEFGYQVDTSITPSVDWRNSYGPDFSDARDMPYYIDTTNILKEDRHSPLLEVPATIGFLQKDFKRCQRISKIFRKPVLQHFKLLGLFEKIGVLNKRWLSPEVATGEEMIRLATNYVLREASSLTLVFHSNCLMPGLTPFVRCKSELEDFLDRIETFLSYCRNQGWDIAPLRSAVDLYPKKGRKQALVAGAMIEPQYR